MEKYTLDEWWAGLTVPQKERIAGKVAKCPVHYPECTIVWNKLTAERKQRIHDHCTDEHGLIRTDWTEGTTYSY